MVHKSILLFVIINCTVALQELSSPFNNTVSVTDNILCRNCGIIVSSSNHIISKLTDSSQKSVYDNLYGKENVLIQVLESDFLFQFPVITTEQSLCVGVGKWEESYSWYPGYRWRPCACPECGVYVGWVFEPININWAHPHTFFSLILTSIVGESFVDSLIQYPEDY